MANVLKLVGLSCPAVKALSGLNWGGSLSPERLDGEKTLLGLLCPPGCLGGNPPYLSNPVPDFPNPVPDDFQALCPEFISRIYLQNLRPKSMSKIYF